MIGSSLRAAIHRVKYGAITPASRCLAPVLGGAFRIKFRNDVMNKDILFIGLKKLSFALLLR